MNIMRTNETPHNGPGVVVASDKVGDAIAIIKKTMGDPPLQSGGYVDPATAWTWPGMSSLPGLTHIWLKKGPGLDYWTSEESLRNWACALDQMQAA